MKTNFGKPMDFDSRDTKNYRKEDKMDDESQIGFNSENEGSGDDCEMIEVSSRSKFQKPNIDVKTNQR